MLHNNGFGASVALDRIGKFQTCVFNESSVVIAHDGFFSKLKFMPQERVRNQMNLVGVDIFVKTRLVKREI